MESEVFSVDAGGERRAFVEREYLATDDLLNPDHLKNGGRRRPWIQVGLEDNLDDEESDLSGSRRDRPKSLDYWAMQAVGWLAGGGWHIREASATGQKPGRPAKGLQGPEFIYQRIRQLAPDFEYKSATREERADLVILLLAPPKPVNRQALADLWGVNRSTITRLNTLGSRRLHQNSAKGGGAVSSA